MSARKAYTQPAADPNRHSEPNTTAEPHERDADAVRIGTEPHECAWAREARFFARVLKGEVPKGALVRVQISPDGIHWCDEGTTLALPAAPGITTSARVGQFGGWLRLVGSLPAGRSLQVIIHLVLKE